jgi:phage shock protein A
MLNLRSIQHLGRIQRLEDKDFAHTTRLNLQHERIEKLEKELEELKKGGTH